MQKIAIILTFVFSSFFNSAFAAVPDASPQNPESAKKIGRKVWMENMQNNLPKILCQKEQYFMSCFTISAEECIDFNKLFVQACLNNAAVGLPAELNPQERDHWGAIIGRCTLDLYEKFMHSKKLAKPECQEVKKESHNQSPKEQQKP
ncbi:MAG: hypothetical protein AB7I18_01115 [Candidatus Berkiella sp.]